MNGKESSRAALQAEWLEGLDIICLANCEYMAVRSVAEHTMIRLARKNRILMVEPFNSLPTLLNEARLQNRQRTARWGIRKVDENLWTFTPPPIGMVGHTRARWVTALNSALFTRLLRSAMRRLDFQDPILWSYHYNSAGVMRRLGARLSVYDCLDNDPAMSRNARQLRIARSHDADTCRAADLMFACCEALAAERRPFKPDIHEVYCAADVEFYERALDPLLPVPEDIARLQKPVIGYWGGVDAVKLDVELLHDIALARPDWSFVLIGYVWFDFDRTTLESLPNVRLFGARPYASLPAYMRQMDVCIAPFALNEVTRHGDSLKIYEYLAAGRPVVSTRIPSALRMSPPVRLADTSAEFIAAIEQALAEPPAQAASNRAAVDQHSWDHRVAQKSRLVRAMLQS